MTGTWSGDWGPTATARQHVTLVMRWDGDRIVGTINPGPDAIPLAGVLLDGTDWTVRLEADTHDAAGAAVRIVVEGRLEDIGSYHRTITGAWTQGTMTGRFRLTRD